MHMWCPLLTRSREGWIGVAQVLRYPSQDPARHRVPPFAASFLTLIPVTLLHFQRSRESRKFAQRALSCDRRAFEPMRRPKPPVSHVQRKCQDIYLYC
ncbi:hypothetical protein K458DRAFT_86161 [Lentithecium fluviatile CBS 122367]|uniref:Uncharacterized protein n=1 Tax=Lentithecium fluviatile CBS 122367 TaxID=1168545 RepID=A0A6G1ISL0_9PLEO|nr:hypothetical protein K458DRAFT_86161 [Lentithecium fluviatile CBS 122367]